MNLRSNKKALLKKKQLRRTKRPSEKQMIRKPWMTLQPKLLQIAKSKKMSKTNRRLMRKKPPKTLPRKRPI